MTGGSRVGREPAGGGAVGRWACGALLPDPGLSERDCRFLDRLCGSGRTTRHPIRQGRNDLHIAYQVVGDGPFDLVAVLGYVSHLELAWEDPAMADCLRRLASFSRLILFDRRGLGMSDPIQGAPTLEDRMQDLRAVMDAAGSERAALFGLSEGGPMSMLFAATYPDRVSALVLYGAFARMTQAEDYPWGYPPPVLDRYVETKVENWGGDDTVDFFAPSVPATSSFGEDGLHSNGGRRARRVPIADAHECRDATFVMYWRAFGCHADLAPIRGHPHSGRPRPIPQ